MNNKTNKEKVIILGAGSPHMGNKPTALFETGSGKMIMHWLLDALNKDNRSIEFIAGYKAEKIKEYFPEISLSINQDWKSMHSTGSFLSSSLEKNMPTIVSYGDILFRKNIVNKLRSSKKPISIAWDSMWNPDINIKSKKISEKIQVKNKNVLRIGVDIKNELSDGKFIGLARFNAEVINEIISIKSEISKLMEGEQLSFFIEYLRTKGYEIEAFDVKGEWAEVTKSSDIASFILGTKAKTLERLSKVVKLSKIQDQITFTKDSWEKNPLEIVEKILNLLGSEKELIIRSSSKSEDSFTSANAGKFKSILNVKPDKKIEKEINEVISSFGENADKKDEVLVQPMLVNVQASGVIFTRTLENGCPWYIINYEESKDTSSITSGNSKNHKTCVIRRDKFYGIENPSWINNLHRSILEIEQLVNYNSLDIEFAIDSDNVVNLLQVRPLVKKHKNLLNDDVFLKKIDVAHITWQRLVKSPPHIPGDAMPAYGLMPDWNPAEIIGTAPGELSLSLYRHLITDEIWARQRAEFGYRDVRPAPLLVTFSGRPYVDIRLSFASFIPKNLPDKLAGKLLKYYLNFLKNNKIFHDKIEFKVVSTCISPNKKEWIEKLNKSKNFSSDEILLLENELKLITLNAFSKPKQFLKGIEELKQKNFEILNSTLEPLEKARILIEDCKNLGTLPFAHLARCGFIAITLLNDAVTAGIISEDAKNSFLNSIETISKEFKREGLIAKSSKKTWEKFVKKYGHLRPGTYDINSKRYDSDDGFLLRICSESEEKTSEKVISPDIWRKERYNFFNSLKNIGLPDDEKVVEEFLYKSIEGREYAKFVFTKNLSDALEQIAIFGKSYNLNREELSNLNIYDILKLRETEDEEDLIKKELKTIAKKNNAKKEISSKLQLPNLIFSNKDLDLFFIDSNIPNFVGTKIITKNFVVIKENGVTDFSKISNKIVLIERADPGYDWLFSQDIAGLVTLYGGANSHMAIRSAEFDLPAAIGVGEKIYKELINSNLIQLDPVKKIIKGLK
tara:strand:+ start:2578 stop:5634 length:3057 start_codon:yes stop_codon:yes gene_type:complete